jgi:hypothetical protein
MIHDAERLPFGIETSEDVGAIRAGLDQLDGDATLGRLLLLGGVDDAHATFADLFVQGVLVVEDGADHFAGVELFRKVMIGSRSASKSGSGRTGRPLRVNSGWRSGKSARSASLGMAARPTSTGRTLPPDCKASYTSTRT